MSQADELLASITDSSAELGDAVVGSMELGASAYTGNPTNEEHIVVGSDRFITVPEALKRIAVQYDHDVETVTFDCPRYWDRLDMSKMKIYINYMRADGEIGGYIAKNITVDETDETIMHFDWTISRNVTEVIGTLSFLVCVKRTYSDGTEKNHWNSELNKDMYVSKGLECEETLLKAYPDIITQLLVRMDYVEAITTEEALLNLLNKYLTTDSEMQQVLQAFVDEYLENDPETLETVETFVNTYIAENLSTTDKTLSKENTPADGAATGEAIKKINEDLVGYIKNSDISTVSKDYVDIGVDDYTEVSASVCMVKLSKNIASIIINYQITANTLAADVYKFIDMDKLKTALGLSYLGFHFGATAVILQPAISYSDGSLTENTSYATEEQRGYTGLMFSESGGFCRIYEMGKTAGVWPLQCAMYKPGTYGTIIINGATIA